MDKNKITSINSHFVAIMIGQTKKRQQCQQCQQVRLSINKPKISVNTLFDK